MSLLDEAVILTDKLHEYFEAEQWQDLKDTSARRQVILEAFFGAQPSDIPRDTIIEQVRYIQRSDQSLMKKVKNAKNLTVQDQKDLQNKMKATSAYRKVSDMHR